MKEQRRILKPSVAITKAELEGDAIEQALGLLPLENLINNKDTVAIIPNLVKDMPPETGTIVGPESLRTIIGFVKSKNPARIVIAAGSGGNNTPQVIRNNGFKKVIDEEKVEFIDLNYGPYFQLALNHNHPPSTELNVLINETDVLISFAQLKLHQEATATMTIKNMALSCPPAELHGSPKFNLGIHYDLHGFISAMAEKIPIDLAILSTDKSMVGTGPSDGKPVKGGMIIAGTDPVSVDVIGARLLGFLPQAVHYLYRLIQAGIGEGDLNKVDLKGIPLNEAEKLFSQEALGYDIIVDLEQIKNIDHMYKYH